MSTWIHEEGIRTGRKGRGKRSQASEIADAICEISTLSKNARTDKAKNQRKAESVYAEIAEENLKSVKKSAERKEVKRLYCKFARRMADLPDRTLLCNKYWRNHEFLSQQIDERSHQVFTMGPLFVPIAFLIFTYTVVNDVMDATAYLLMVSSLTCIGSWFLFYRRVQRQNESSYPHILAYELVLGLSCHFTMKQFYEASRLMRWSRHAFRVAFFILGSVWTLYLTYFESASFTKLLDLLQNPILFSLCLMPAVVSSIPVLSLLVNRLRSSLNATFLAITNSVYSYLGSNPTALQSLERAGLTLGFADP